MKNDTFQPPPKKRILVHKGLWIYVDAKKDEEKARTEFLSKIKHDQNGRFIFPPVKKYKYEK